MAYPSLTYSAFTSGTTADGSQVIQNFNDLLNGITDGTKDLNVNAITVAGTTTLNGTITLGNAFADTITINGGIGSDPLPSAVEARSLGSTSYPWVAVYVDNGSTHGGRYCFDAGATEYLGATAAGTELVTGGFTNIQLDEDYGIKTAGATGYGWISNAGVTITSNTLTITGHEQSAISASNPIWVCLPSTTSGKLIPIKFTSNIAITDDGGTSEMTGALWGTTTSIAWGQNLPLYIYAVMKDSDAGVSFFLARVPTLDVAPAAAYCGKAGTPAACSTEKSALFIDSGVTVTDYDSNPCICLGSVRAQKNDAGNDDWTFASLTMGYDGFGKFNEHTQWTFPTNQNGAVANYHISSAGGTELPTWATPANITYTYFLKKDGRIKCSYSTTDAGNCTQDGSAGSDQIYLHIPLSPSINHFYRACGGYAALGSATSYPPAVAINSGNQYAALYYFNAGVLSNVTENQFSNAADDLYYQFEYNVQSL